MLRAWHMRGVSDCGRVKTLPKALSLYASCKSKTYVACMAYVPAMCTVQDVVQLGGFSRHRLGVKSNELQEARPRNTAHMSHVDEFHVGLSLVCNHHLIACHHHHNDDRVPRRCSHRASYLLSFVYCQGCYLRYRTRCQTCNFSVLRWTAPCRGTAHHLEGTLPRGPGENFRYMEGNEESMTFANNI